MDLPCLCSGYGGEKAMRFKETYINRFNQMGAFIQSLLTTKLEFPAFTEAIMLSQWNFA
jgi:phage regulator Rha-like protein